MDTGHWIYPSTFDPKDWFGFVYRIIDTVTQKEYIGKKQFFSKRSKRVVGKVNKTWKSIPSKWESYTSSSETINKLIAEHGKERFVFLIESLHATKASLTYAEVERMISENVLRAKFDDGTRKYFNGVIPPIKFLPPEETVDEEAARLFTIIQDKYPNGGFAWEHSMSDEEKEAYRIKYRFGVNNSTRRLKTAEEYEKYLDDHFRGENNPMFGRTGELSPRFGMHPFANLTKEELIEAKQLMAHKGESNGMFGRHPFANLTEDQIAEVKEKMSHKGEDNAMFGRPWYLDAPADKIQQWKENISKTTKGIPKSEATKEKMRKPKGAQQRGICVYCGLECGLANLKKYHNENCKQAPSPVPRAPVKTGVCPYCAIETNLGNLAKNHGENCKLKPI